MYILVRRKFRENGWPYERNSLRKSFRKLKRAKYQRRRKTCQVNQFYEFEHP